MNSCYLLISRRPYYILGMRQSLRYEVELHPGSETLFSVYLPPWELAFSIPRLGCISLAVFDLKLKENYIKQNHVSPNFCSRSIR